MDTNGVKVTYIETQFVTSDAASFKSLVQRLTGKSAEATEPAPQLHQPRPCRPGTDGRGDIAGEPSYSMPTTAASTAPDDVRRATPGASQPCLNEMHGLSDYSESLYVVGASDRHHGSSYTDLVY
ncbi:hypothetical protein ACQ4PT_005053 [Festuca glaucescens]